jgi:YD repeat-containing protein
MCISAYFKFRSLMGLAMALTFPLYLSGQSRNRYFYDDSNQLYRIMDQGGNLVEYTYDPVGNITQIARSVLPPGSLSILNVTPRTAGPGTQVTLYGQGFSGLAAGNTVRFNGLLATVVSATPTELVVTLPVGNSTGPVTITVNGVTASSGSILFTGLKPPTLLTVAPDGGFAGRRFTATITGTDLSEAIFTTVPAGGAISDFGATTDFSALVGINVPSPGLYTVVATNSAGSSTSAPLPGNQIRILESSGETYFPLIVLNTAAPPAGTPDPSTVSNETAGDLVSVLNVAAPPPGTADPSLVSNETSSTLATVLNLAAPPPGTADPSVVSNQASGDLLAILNTAPPPPGTTDPSSVSNVASSDNLTVLNGAAPPPGTADPSLVANEATALTTTVRQLTTPTAAPIKSAAPSNLERTASDGETVLSGLEVMAGETVRLRAQAGPGETVEFLVNGISFGADEQAPYQLTFEAPHAIGTLIVTAVARAGASEARLLDTLRLTVTAERRTVVQGRVVDEAGQPVANAKVELQTEGLLAEVFDSTAAVTRVPDLTGQTPSSRRLVAGLNQLNPRGVFGQDPLAWRASPDYAVRYTALLRIEREGEYGFALRSHAGALMRIDGQEVGNAAIHLTAGEHAFEVIHYEATGLPELQLLWAPLGGELSPVPQRQFVAKDPELVATTDAEGNYRLLQVPTSVGVLQVTVGEGSAKVSSEPVMPAPVGVTEIKEVRVRGRRE